MADTPEYSPELNAKRTAIAAFLTALVTSAKTSGLYKPGHPSIIMIGQRVVALLNRTLGQETTLTLDVKAKTVIVEESEIPDSAEVTAFAAALHTLGIGQVLFTNRVSGEGMVEFFKVLTAKPDEKTTLTDLQKTVQDVKIDGLQMVFILNFVVTGEQEEEDQPPGRLTEEQVLAFIRSETIPDFLTLLYHQNEAVHGKEAEKVGDLLDGTLFHEVPWERFEAEMSWAAYDPRIRARWDELRAAAAWTPKSRGAGARKGAPRQSWGGKSLVSWAALLDAKEIEAKHAHRSMEKKEAVQFSMDKIHAILAAPASPAQLKYGVFAYIRLLAELGRDGNLPVLLAEFRLWQAMAADPGAAASFAELRKGIEAKVAVPILAEQLVQFLLQVPGDKENLEPLADFCAFLGAGFLPLLLEQLRNVQDKDHRAKLCSLLVLVGKQVGTAPLVAALQDQDYFLVLNVVAILGEMDLAANAPLYGPMVFHSHAKVRDLVVRQLSKAGGPAAVENLGKYVIQKVDDEEVHKVVIAFSLLSAPGVGKALIEAYRKATVYESQVAVATALGRHGGPETVAVLKEAAQRTWLEILMGRKKDLHNAAKHSLEILRKEGHS